MTKLVREAPFSQTRDGVGNGDGGQTAAICEARPSQTRDGICDAIISHCLRHYNLPLSLKTNDLQKYIS